MDPKEMERRSTVMPPEDWAALESLAKKFEAYPPSGPTAPRSEQLAEVRGPKEGQTSWRTLVKEIARYGAVIDGVLVVKCPETEPE